MRERVERIPGLDALRALAMLLVVALHGAIPYVDVPLGRLPWAVHDGASSLLSHVFWWLHGFLMPLFFLLAGFLAAQVVEQRGARAFLRQRTRRIFAPFVLGCLVLLPITFGVFASGWWLSGDCTWSEIRRMKFSAHIQPQLYGPAHLWFLEYLFIYCLAYTALRTVRPAVDGTLSRLAVWHDWLLGSRWRVLWCAVPTALIIALDPDVFTTHRNAFVPSALRLAHYGVFFAVGAGLYRQRAELSRLLRTGGIYLLLSVPIARCVESLVQAQRGAGLSIVEQAVFAILVALLAWCALFGWLGLCLVAFTRPRAGIRRLVDASYWAYLVHLPIVAALQIALTQVSVPAVVKCVVASGLTVALCLWSYERLVVRRWLFIAQPLRRPSAFMRRLTSAWSSAWCRRRSGGGPSVAVRM
jgi:peptidoglycan/LPS O-acetylase OafA/YrhL